jgi:hypothetical protein
MSLANHHKKSKSKSMTRQGTPTRVDAETVLTTDTDGKLVLSTVKAVSGNDAFPVANHDDQNKATATLTRNPDNTWTVTSIGSPEMIAHVTLSLRLFYLLDSINESNKSVLQAATSTKVIMDSLFASVKPDAVSDPTQPVPPEHTDAPPLDTPVIVHSTPPTF